MRDMANTSNNHPKWIVLDGDIDPMWIESLNTVMDDNKVWLDHLYNNTRRPCVCVCVCVSVRHASGHAHVVDKKMGRGLGTDHVRTS